MGASTNPTVNVRLSAPLSDALAAAAAADNMSRAGWARIRIADALATRGAPRSQLPPSPPRRPPVIPPADLAAVSRLSADLSRVGGALVQFCKVMRQSGHPAYADAESTLAELRAVQSAVLRAVAALSHDRESK